MAGRIHAIGVEMRMFPLLLVRIRSRVFRADIRFSFDEGDDSLVRHVFERGGLVDRTIKCFKVFEITIDFFFFLGFCLRLHVDELSIFREMIHFRLVLEGRFCFERKEYFERYLY